MLRYFLKFQMLPAIAIAAVALPGAAHAAIYLNEVYIDSPGGGDDDEYFEIRGASTDSLTDVFFIQLENEQTSGNDPGIVDFVYDLTGESFSGALDYLWFSEAGEDYPSSFGAPDGTYSGNTMENSGGTFLLVSTGGVGTDPTAGHVWDSNDDGVFDTNWNSSWTVLDAIGVFTEADDISGSGNDGRLYANINFAPGVFTAIRTEGLDHAENGGAAIATANVDTSRAALNGTGSNANAFTEIEYVGRNGDSTGIAVANVDDWNAANLTNDPASGYTSGSNNYGISGNHDDGDMPEVVKGDNVVAPFAYGTDVTVTLGSANISAPEPGTATIVVLGIASLAALNGRRRAT